MIVDESLIVRALTPIGIPKFAGVQLRYNCPRCENELGMDIDKHNLEVNTVKLAYKCWACGQHGSVYNLVKKYGYSEFADYFKTKKDNIENNQTETKVFELPPYLVNVLNIPEAVEYLLERGLTKYIIKQRNVKMQ